MLGKRREPTQIAKENRHFPLLAAQLQVTSGIGDDLGSHLRRNIPAEESAEQTVLRLNLIVERLDPEKRLDPGQELLAVKGFTQKIVGARFDPANPVGDLAEHRQHHDRQEATGLISADTLADLVP